MVVVLVVVVVGGTVVVVVVVVVRVVVVVVVAGSCRIDGRRGGGGRTSGRCSWCSCGCRGRTKVHSAVAQSCGWAATTTSTPGIELKVHTLRAGPVCRQASDGVVGGQRAQCRPGTGPVPSDEGGVTGVRGTCVMFQVPIVVYPLPGGRSARGRRADGGRVVGPVW